MQNLEVIFKHEDERRTLIELFNGVAFKNCKVIIAKSNEPIGGHYHLKKDDLFMLLSGLAKRVVIGDDEEEDIPPIRKWFVPRKTFHLFELEPGSILLEASTTAFDSDDEVRGKPRSVLK